VLAADRHVDDNFAVRLDHFRYRHPLDFGLVPEAQLPLRIAPRGPSPSRVVHQHGMHDRASSRRRRIIIILDHHSRIRPPPSGGIDDGRHVGIVHERDRPQLVDPPHDIRRIDPQVSLVRVDVLDVPPRERLAVRQYYDGVVRPSRRVEDAVPALLRDEHVDVVVFLSDRVGIAPEVHGHSRFGGRFRYGARGTVRRHRSFGFGRRGRGTGGGCEGGIFRGCVRRRIGGQRGSYSGRERTQYRAESEGVGLARRYQVHGYDFVEQDPRGSVAIDGVADAELAAVVQSRAVYALRVVALGDEEDALGGGTHAEEAYHDVFGLDRDDISVLNRVHIRTVAQLSKVVPTASADATVLVQYVARFPDGLEGYRHTFVHLQRGGISNVLPSRVRAQLAVRVAPREVQRACVLGEE